MTYLDQSKRDVYLNKLNFLGYQTEVRPVKTNLRKIKYIGEYTNKFITLDHRGLIPSISRLMNFGGKKQKKGLETQVQTKVEETPRDKNNFKYFWKFMADNETFLIPIDHENFESSCLDKDLLFDVINGR